MLTARVCAIVVVLPLLGCSGNGGGDATPPAISGVQISPSILLYQGEVQASLQVQDNAGIQEVKVIAEGPTTVSANLSSSGGGVYAGQVSLPVNDSGAEALYEVRIEATDTSGNTARSTAVQVMVDGPPAPPGA